MISELTKEQESKIEVYRNKWLEYTTNNSEINEDKAKEVITWAYEFAGYTAPKEFIFLDSLVQCNDAINKRAGNKKKERYSFLFSKLGWSGYYCFYDFVLNELFPSRKDEFPLLETVREFVQYSGLFFPFEDVVYVSRQPVNVVYDDQGRLHNTEGMAIEFPDGTGSYSLDGIYITKEMFLNIKNKTSATDILKISNAEQRLVAIKYFGVQNMLSELNGRVEDTYKDYVLHSVEIEGSREKLLEMQNPSEPKKHYEFVPPEINTCKQAMAWRVGLEIYSEPKTYS